MTPSVDTGMSPPTQQTYGEVLLLKKYMSWKCLMNISIEEEGETKGINLLKLDII